MLEIYNKAIHIVHLVNAFLSTFLEDDTYWQVTKGLMMEDVAIIAAKIAGAVGGDLYSIRMQNASLVREHAIHLYMQVVHLRFFKNYKDIKYVDMLRNVIEKFQMLSTAWAGSFDGTNRFWEERKLVN